VMLEGDRIRTGVGDFTLIKDANTLHRVPCFDPLDYEPKQWGIFPKHLLSRCKWFLFPENNNAQLIREKDKEMVSTLQFFKHMKNQTEINRTHASTVMYNRQAKEPESEFPAHAVSSTMYFTDKTLVAGRMRPCVCFSCGGSSSSRMPGRLCVACHSTREGDPLVKAIREGKHVCSWAVPVRYPGVVNTVSRHPPLKTGTETWATKEVKVKGATISEVLKSDPRERPGPRLLGIGLSGAYPFVTSAGARPLLEAIMYRVFKKVDREQPSKRAFNKLAEHASLLLPGFTEPLEPMDQWEWICSYTNSRRRHQLIKARNERAERGHDHEDYGKISAFVKTEKLPFFKIVGGVPFSWEAQYIARLIQAPHDETHLDAGPYLKALTKRLKKVWGPHHWIFYGSTTPENLDEWLNTIADCETFFFADYSAFDATHSRESWALIEGLYEKVFPRKDYPELWRAIDVWRKPVGKCKLRRDKIQISYRAPVCNASGRDDTALANALLNGLCLSAAFAAELAGVELEDLKPEHFEKASASLRISVVGDDSIVGCRFDVTKYDVVRHLRRFGLIVKSETASDIACVTYLGQMPYRVGSKWLWGPTLGRRLFKAYWQCEPIGHPVAWVRGVAQQLSLHRHVPILVETAEKVLSLTKGPITTMRDENKPWAARNAPTPNWGPETVQALARRYGAHPFMIMRDIEIVKSIQRVPAVVDLPFVGGCVAVDDC